MKNNQAIIVLEITIIQIKKIKKLQSHKNSDIKRNHNSTIIKEIIIHHKMLHLNNNQIKLSDQNLVSMVLKKCQNDYKNILFIQIKILKILVINETIYIPSQHFFFYFLSVLFPFFPASSSLNVFFLADEGVDLFFSTNFLIK